MNSILAFLIGLLLAGAVFALFLGRQKKQERQWAKRAAELAAEAQKAFEMLESHPHGLIIRDSNSGRDIATDKLVQDLNLPADSDQAFDDLCLVLSDADRERLQTASMALGQYGKGFDLLLHCRDQPRSVFHASGRLVSTDGGTPMAQVVWISKPDERFRLPVETSQPMKAKAFTIPQGDDRVAVETLLDLLPFPAWRRDQALDAVYVNEAGRRSIAVEATQELAKTALEEGRKARAVLETENGDHPIHVVEAPLDGAFGTIGFAIDDAMLSGGGLDSAPPSTLYPMLDGLHHGVAVFSPDKRLVHSNKAYSNLWPLDRDWLNGQPTIRQIMDQLREKRLLPEVPDYRRFRDEQASLIGTLNETREDRWHLPDGRTVHQVSTPGPDGSLIMAFEDVSDRLLLERSFKALDVTRREMLDNLSEAVAIFGMDGQMVLGNPPFKALWGLGDDAMDSFTLKGLVDHLAGWVSEPGGVESRRLLAALGQRTAATGLLAGNAGQMVDIRVYRLTGESLMITAIDLAARPIEDTGSPN